MSDEGLRQLWDSLGQYNDRDREGDCRARPFEFLDLESNKELAKWKKEFYLLSDEALAERIPTWLDNARMFNGMHFTLGSERRRNPETKDNRRQSVRRPFPIGITNELVEQKVSKITANKTAVKAIPPKNTHASRNSARLADKVIKYLAYTQDTDTLWQKWQRAVYVFGEADCWADWYPEKGPIDPDYEKLVEQARKKGNDPERVVVHTDSKGNKLYASAVKRQGEVGFRVLMPWQLRYELYKHPSEAKYCFIEQRVYEEYAKAKWGDKDLVDDEGNEVKIEDLVGDDGKVPVYILYHIESEFLSGGYKVVYVGDSPVEKGPHPHNSDRLPVHRLTDLDIPNCYHAMSFIERVKHLNRAYDGVTFLMLKAMAQGAHLKWVVQKRSCNHYSLADLDTIVEYSGNVAPRLEMPKTLTSEMFKLRDAIKAEIKELAGGHGVAINDIPKRMDSSLAVQELDENETKRELTSISKHRTAIKETWQNAIDIMGKHYDPDTDRIVRVVGIDDELSIETIKGADIAGPFEIRIVGVNALPDTPSGKTERIAKFNEMFPGYFSPEFVMDTLEMHQDERFVTYATVAVRKAEAINDALLAEKKVPEPRETDDLITHWQILMKFIQSMKFEEAPDIVQKRSIERLGTLEFLMWKRTTKVAGRGYSAKLQVLDGYPVVFNIPDPATGNAQGAPVPLVEGSAATQAPVPGPQGEPPQTPAAQQPSNQQVTTNQQ